MANGVSRFMLSGAKRCMRREARFIWRSVSGATGALLSVGLFEIAGKTVNLVKPRPASGAFAPTRSYSRPCYRSHANRVKIHSIRSH